MGSFSYSLKILQVLIRLLDLSSPFFDWVAALDFGVLGYVVVGLFLLAWGVSVAVWKLGRVEERYAPVGSMHAHVHRHPDGTEHSHRHVH